MKHVITLLMLVLVIATAMPVLAQERVDSKIRFNDLYGEVSIRPNSEEDDAYEYAEFDTVIYEEDRIRTKEDSGAILGLEDMSTFVIKPESIVVIHTEDDNTTNMEMLAGHIVGNIKKMSEGKTWGFEMSQCVAGIKGTFFRLEQSKDGNINKIDVINGLIEVNSKSDGKIYQVPAGQSLTIKAGGEVASSTIDVEAVKQEALSDIKKMDDKSNDEELLKKLNNKSSGMKDTIKGFTDRFNSCYSRKNITNIDELNTEFESLRVDVVRYKGELEEANVLIEVAANRRSKDANISKAINKASLGLKEQCENYEALLKKVMAFGNEIEKLKNSSSLISNEELESVMNSIKLIDGKLDEIYVDAKNTIDVLSDQGSYDDFKVAKEKCNQLLEDLRSISSEVSYLVKVSETSKGIAALNTKSQNIYKYIKKSIKDFESVPEISSDLRKNMNDIEKLIPDYAQRVKDYLAQYNAIEKSSVDAQKRYVETVSKLLVSYDRTKRQYVKASRMHDQIERDFSKSSFKTAEYNEVKDSWDRIESAMTELDNESSELSSCLDALKSQLEAMMGQ